MAFFGFSPMAVTAFNDVVVVFVDDIVIFSSDRFPEVMLTFSLGSDVAVDLLDLSVSQSRSSSSSSLLLQGKLISYCAG